MCGPRRRSNAPSSIDREKWVSSAASLLLGRTVARMPKQAWGADGAAGAVYAALLTPEAIGSAISEQLARLEVSALTLRTLDAHTMNLATGSEITDRFRVESGTASLVRTVSGGRLDYTFRSSSDAPIVLVDDFVLPASVETERRSAGSPCTLSIATE